MALTLDYSPPALLFNKHLETIYPSLFRNVTLPPYMRERIITPDDDFLDLDWLRAGSPKLIIISHGLEGDSHRSYVKGMARAGFLQGYDILAWNYRGCSGEMNRQLRFYHSGATDDLSHVIQHATASHPYEDIYLIGFSLGGNLTLKYLGENPSLAPTIKKAVAFSVPIDLGSCADKIAAPENFIYQWRFLESLKKKILDKSKVMKGLNVNGLETVSTLREFDNLFTAPLHGFEHAEHYYASCSANRFMNNISIPTLLVNAQNDPFLSSLCYPHESLKGHPYVRFESPLKGGHVGFTVFSPSGQFWSEMRALHFIARDLGPVEEKPFSLSKKFEG